MPEGSGAEVAPSRRRSNPEAAIVTAGRTLAIAAMVSVLHVAPVGAEDITVGAYNKLSSEAQSKVLQDTYFATAEKVLTMLRSSTDTHGNPKTAERLQSDRERANRFHETMLHVDSDKLADMIERALEAAPNANLENVILAYFLSEEKARNTNPK